MADPEAIRIFEHTGWERAAKNYPASFASATRQFIPALLDAAAVAAGQSTLDVACGPGFVAAAAAERGADVRGLDFSAAMLRVARNLHPQILFDQADAESLPYADNSFDAVISNFGIHHVPQPLLALKQAYRVMKPGGSLAFTIWAAPNENIAWKLVFDAIGRCGNLSASDAPASGGGFGTSADCLAALTQSDFNLTGSQRVVGVWRQTNGQALLDALRAGTARMAALIEAQPHEAITAISADIDRAAAAYRVGDGLDLPLVAYVAHGRKA